MALIGFLNWRRYRAGRKKNSSDEGQSRPVVWMVNQYAIPLDVPGITRHVELARQLEGLGWSTRIFAAAFHHTTATELANVSWLRPAHHDVRSGVPFTWLVSSGYRGNGLKRYVNMLTFTAALIGVGARQRRPDIIVGSSPHLLAGFGAWLLARRFRVPFIFEVRDMWPDMLVQLGLTTPLIITPLKRLEAFLYKRADRVIALTDGIAERVAAKGVDADRIEVVPNGILRPAPIDDDTRDAMRRALGWEGKVVVVWAGSHNPMNGLDVVIEAARLLRGHDAIRFAFIGDGALKMQLIEQARGLDNVVFHDPLPKTEMSAWLRAADLGLLHSRRFEVFSGARPNKLFDYMAAGLPIVSTVPGEAWSLIERVNAGVFAEWENPEALAEAVMRLAKEPVERRAMGWRAFASVSETHSREATAVRLAGLLTEVCRQQGMRLTPDDRNNRTPVPSPADVRSSQAAVTSGGRSNAHAAD